MTCPECGGKTVVIDVRHTNYNENYRKRQCKECGNIFYTTEYEIEFNKNLNTEWLSLARGHKNRKRKII